jgi:hypothetical protein
MFGSAALNVPAPSGSRMRPTISSAPLPSQKIVGSLATARARTRTRPASSRQVAWTALE